MIERDLVERAFDRPARVMEHSRQRLDGELGIVLDGDHVIAISAYRIGLVSFAELALPRLDRLDVGGNGLVELAPVPPSVRELYVYDNQLERLPALPSLRVLDANRNRLVELPALRDVEFVYAASNRLVGPPPMSGCRYANFSSNPLATIPDDVDLEELRMEDAGLTGLPSHEMRGLTSVRELHLRGNAMTELDPTIERMVHLRVLDLRGNQLDTLPACVKGLPHLRKLDLRWNPLRRAPDWLDELRANDTLVYT